MANCRVGIESGYSCMGQGPHRVREYPGRSRVPERSKGTNTLRRLPAPFLYSSMVEHMTVNHGVVGSNPTGGAIIMECYPSG